MREIKPNILDFTRSIVVENWEKVCRDNTDIEIMHPNRDQKKNTRSIADVVLRVATREFSKKDATVIWSSASFARIIVI
ncbi:MULTISPECIES: hypothetical protein [Paenibacillus]|uniref:hypothetical protein n=1 Tax=Paenibacillus TaxID=44249 RepID=UPI00117ED1F8|nr:MULTISPECIES: hypothetical protein [Paenibacillus]MDH6447573.1 hypothetical protein [Paenibacillus sp. PastF-4]